MEKRDRCASPESMFDKINLLLRTLAVVGILGIGGWWTMFARSRMLEHEQELETRDQRIAELAVNLEQRELRIGELDREVLQKEQRIEELDEDLELAEEEIQELSLSLKLLKLDHRVARLEVLDQGPLEGRTGADGEPLVETTVRFTELGPDGEPAGEPVEATIEGTRVYIESLVIKFDDDFVEAGDHLRGTSVVLFKSLFGRDQSPSEGTPIDDQGAQPRIYGDEDGPDPLHAELWERFWEYANDPELAREKGVRALQGEAPFMELKAGKKYRVNLRASDGLTIQAEW